MHPSAGGPPVVVENLVRESIKWGHESEIISTPMFCRGDEQILLKNLNALAPTTFLERSGVRLPFDGSSRRLLERSVRDADVVHVHTLWNPINVLARR